MSPGTSRFRVILLICLTWVTLSGSLGQARAANFSASDLIAAVNALRASLGLAAYQVDSGLMAYAQEHSEYQARRGSGTHTHSDGSTPFSRGIQENVANGTENLMTLDFIIYQIWSDPVHWKTMAGYSGGTVGAGVASKDGTVYVTLNVRPSGTASSGNLTANLTSITPIAPVLTSTPNPDGSIYHVVGYGQGLWSIAIAYGIKINDIRALNGIPADSTVIYTNQKLLIRAGGTLTPTVPLTPTSTSRPVATRTPTRTLKPSPTRTPQTTVAASATATLPELTPPASGNASLIGRNILVALVFFAAGVILVIFFMTFRK